LLPLPFLENQRLSTIESRNSAPSIGWSNPFNGTTAAEVAILIFAVFIRRRLSTLAFN